MKVSKLTKSLLYLAAILAAMIAWRAYSPYSIPRLLEMFGDDAVRLWSQPYFHLGEMPVTPALLIKAFLFLVVLALIVPIVRRQIRSIVIDRLAIDDGQKYALERGITYLLFALGIVIGLQSAGVNLSSLAVFGGALGIGIGFGLQTIAKNFAAGLILLIERPIKAGDRVEVGTLMGDVIKIGSRGTWVRTNDNVVIIVPNSEFVESRVTNWTANDRRVRINVPLGVSYSSDPEQVRKILLNVARNHPDVVNPPEPDVIFRGFGDSSLDFDLRVWTTKHVTTPKIIASDLYFAIFKAFAEQGIEIPFPQRDLHLRSISTQIPWMDERGAARGDVS